MIRPDTPEDEKLREIRSQFEMAYDHYFRPHEEQTLVTETYSNTRMRGQWQEDELEYLEAEGRPALTFNLVKPKIDQVLGMWSDFMRKPTAVPVGAEDDFAASVIDNLVGRLLAEAKWDLQSMEIKRWELVRGEHNVHVNVEPHPTKPGWVQVELLPIESYEVMWDVDSQYRDRRDARYLFWSKWMSKLEFKAEYPDFSDEWEALRGDSYGDPSASIARVPVGNESSLFWDESRHHTRDYNRRRLYYDKTRNLIRVLRMEYLVPTRVWLLSNPQTGASEEIEEDMARELMAAQEAGLATDMRVTSVMRDVAHYTEFIGSTILEEGLVSQSFDGFSLRVCGCFFDPVERVNYGLVRNMVDPQKEVNKAYSQALDHLVSQSKPGMIMEEDAVTDVEQFESQYRTPAGVAFVAPGALTGGKLQERKVPEFSPGAAKRLSDSTLMLDRISGISSDGESPGGMQEAATTVAIRYRKSMLSLMDVFGGYDQFEQSVYRMLIQVVTRSMPSDQIASILSNTNRYQVQGTLIQEVAPLPEGMAPTGQMIDIAQLRDMEYDVELDTTSENPTMRLAEMQNLLQLLDRGIAVDPELLLRKAVASRYDRETSVQYLEQQAASQAEAQQAQDQAQQEQMGQIMDVEYQKLGEEQRSNRAKEANDRRGDDLDFWAKFLSTLERADADERRALTQRAGRFNG